MRVARHQRDSHPWRRTAALAGLAVLALALACWLVSSHRSGVHAQVSDVVDIIDGGVDVDQSGSVTSADDLDDATLFQGGAGDQVDILDGHVDVNEDGGTATDDLADAVLVAPGGVGAGTTTPTPTASATATLTSTPTPTPTSSLTPTPTTIPVESVALAGGTCNPVASTYPDDTAIATIAGAVAPSSILTAIWWYDAFGRTWYGYAPGASYASNLSQLDRLDAFSICVSSAGAWSRPEI
jgi:hypothetical protein